MELSAGPGIGEQGPGRGFFDPPAYTPDAIGICAASIDQHLRSRRWNDAVASLEEFISRQTNDGACEPGEHVTPESTLVETRLPERLCNKLAAARLHNLREVWQAGAEGIREIRGLGEGAYRTIEREINRAGLKWDEFGCPIEQWEK